MKQKLNLSLLKYADSVTLDKIAQHTPSAPSRNMERIFAASEKKYQYRFVTPEQEFAVSETWEAEPIKKSSIFFQTASAAACLLVCAGTVGGGIWLLNQGRPSQNLQTAELTETETSAPETTSVQPAQVVKETTKSTVKPQTTTASAETQELITPETTAAKETAVQATTSAGTVTTETQTVPAAERYETEFFTETTAESAPEETNVSAPETLPPETQPVMPETEAPLPETKSAEIYLKPLPAEEENSLLADGTPAYQDISFVQPWTDSVIPGFYYSVKQSRQTWDNDFRQVKWVRAIEDEATPQNIETVYAPAYIPDGYEKQFETRAEDTVVREEKNDTEQFGYYCITYANPAYRTWDGGARHHFGFSQYAKNIWGRSDRVLQNLPEDAVVKSQTISPEKSIIVNGHYGLDFSVGKYTLEELASPMCNAEEYSYTWDNGDYIFELFASDISFDEFLKIVESVQPVQ